MLEVTTALSPLESQKQISKLMRCRRSRYSAGGVLATTWLLGAEANYVAEHLVPLQLQDFEL